MNFKPEIIRHRDTLNELRERMAVTFRMRGRSEQHRQAWLDACKAFHGSRSAVDDRLDQVSRVMIAENRHMRKFVFDFLSVDPVFFRSGYRKERLLRMLKPLDLAEDEKAILRQIILRRVHTGALREFRLFCKLMPKIRTDEFLAELRTASRSADGNIKRRALFALGYAVSP
ncbi:MAG: hypothetical protein R3C97_00750 [Geminicoccaceae bacterium]